MSKDAMSYHGLSRDIRTRRDQDKASGAPAAARDAQPGASPGGASGQDWQDDAQESISALLGQVEDETEEEDLLDLAAIRKALAEQQAAPPKNEPPRAAEPQPKEPRKRLAWLDKLLASDKPAQGHEAEAPTPGAAAKASVREGPGPAPAADVPVAVEAAAEAPPPPPPAPVAETPAHTLHTAAMERLFKDAVLTTLLQRGVVTLPQALRVVEQEAAPDQALWRLVAALPGVDRDLIYATAAGLQGFAALDLEAVDASTEFVRGILRLLSPALRERLFTVGLLPVKLTMDPAARRHRLLMATHDPASPHMQPFLDALDMPVDLHYAPEGTVARCLDRVRAEDAAASPDPAPPALDAPGEAAQILDFSGDADFFELQWEPFAEENERTPDLDAPPGKAGAADLQWKSLAELAAPDEASPVGIDPERATPPRGRPADEAGPGADTAMPAGQRPDAHSFDGSPVDLSEHPPVPDVANWTRGQDAPPAAAAGAGARDEPAPEDESRYDKMPDVDLEKIKAKDRVVAMLLRKAIVSPKQVKRAQYKQKEENLKDPIWRVLTTVDGAPRNAIFAEAAGVYAFRTAAMGEGKPDHEFARSVMDTFEEELRDTLLKLRVVPFEVDLDPQTGAIKVVFITHDPTRPEVNRMMQKLKLERFELRYAPEGLVTGLILEAFPRRNEFLDRLAGDNAFDLGMSYDERELVDEEALEAEISRSKLINLFEATLVEAVRQGASDVHIWPNAKKQVEIHFRLDGRLQRWHLEDKIHPEALIAVIKDNAMNVDRFERDAAQDGFIQRWIDEALIRFRVSVLPIANAAADVRSESIVIRVLDDRKVIKDLRKLGLHEVSYQRFSKAIRQPHGMVILTGPTGSGKTTTLYASLHEVVTPEVNVLTVEDPVEYILPGVRQIKLNHKLGLEGALRSILRHDPDIVMVGEMRDRETAELAIKLANTGHLTFSTLHTNDAASAVTRLYKMGIEPFLIAYAINLVVAQRLIRQLCKQCKKVDRDPDPVLLKNLGFTAEDVGSLTFYTEGQDERCPTCKGLGYKGRRAVTEALYFSRELRHLIADSEGRLDEQDIKALAVKQGMLTLQDSAREVVKEGDTSILEMLRVIASED